MKPSKNCNSNFEKTSPKTAEEIKASCEALKSSKKSDYDIRSNGNHIWVEMGENKQQYWSPMMHLRLIHDADKTSIRGEFAENPLLWIAFLTTKIASIAVFLLSGIVIYLKNESGSNFNTELFLMFAMVSLWFGMYLISERYKRKGAHQIAELQEFAEELSI